MPFTKYILRRSNHALKQQDDPIINTRIRLLSACLLAFTGLFAVLTTLYAFQGNNFMLYRASACLLLFLVNFIAMALLVSWRIIAHLFIIGLTLLIWSNILFFIPGVNMVTVQYTVLVIACAYYILGPKWGMVYSSISVLPVIGDVLLENYTGYDITIKHFALNNHAYVFTACFNFGLLSFVNYLFFRALNKASIKEKTLRTNLQNALLDAEELAVAKTNFLTTMSHQLRTPLNAVVGMTNILLMEDPKPAQKANLNILRFSAENLMATVNDILDFNKINNEKIRLEKQIFKPAELISNIVDTFKPAAREKRIRLSYDRDAALQGLNVIGDPMRLTQILFQLVGNAIKFTAKGSVHLDVKISARNEETANFHFSVADTGIGIPEDVKAGIFEPFSVSTPRTSRQFHGALGLTIAFHLIKLHNSELIFQSEEGVGTTFEFDLSYPVTDEPQAPEPAKAISAIGGMRVLVVEDEKLNIMVIKKLLTKWGIMPDVALDGQQAVNCVTTKDYDVILMDINMPVMDGFEAARQIRQLPLPHKASIPIIAVTASIGAAVDQITQYPFIDDCLLKPFNPEHLREKLMEIAGRNVLK